MMGILFQNLMFASDADDAELKVVDFGFARLRPRDCDVGDESGAGSRGGMRTPCFTLQYAAPEVLDQSPHAAHLQMSPTGSAPSNPPSDGYNESCDLWSLGVILVRELPTHFS